jgi:hypothetical protein
MEMEVTVITEACNSNFMKGRFLSSEYFEVRRSGKILILLCRK